MKFVVVYLTATQLVCQSIKAEISNCSLFDVQSKTKPVILSQKCVV